MTKINSLEELKVEYKKLGIRRIALELELQKNFVDLKAELEPLKFITKSGSKLLISKDNGILGNATGFFADFITNNILLKNSTLLTRLIVPYLVKNATGNLVKNNQSKIVDFAGKLFSKFIKKSNEN